ncbi:MAG: hypothetical protein IH624_16780 [Phycisphaerae bacterium]|nr:hypothetical protein [Phycisphaerae bacterium]
MEKAILIIGVALVLWGLLIAIRPHTLRTTIHVMEKGLLVYAPAAVRIVLGVVFLLAARDCRVPWLIVAFGIIMFVAGVVMFMIRPGRLRSFLHWWAERSMPTLRILGVTGAAIGGLIAWAA